MINYNWNCKTVDVKPTEGDLSNVVYNVHWIVEASKGDISTTSIGTKQVEVDEDVDFVDFDDLKNATVVGWVKEAMGEDEVDAIEAGLAATIAEKENPTSVTMTIED
jgi:hypothetical protein